MSFERKLRRRNITPIRHMMKQCDGKCEYCKWYVQGNVFAEKQCTYMVYGRGRKQGDKNEKK